MNRTDLEDQLIRHEGQVTKDGKHTAYQDHLGYWTIGYGRLIDPKLNGGISDTEARMMLANDISSAMRDTYNALPWISELDSVRFYALINMAFNMGVPRLLGFKKMLAALNDNDFQRAADEALDSKWASQVGGRAIELAEQIRTGNAKY